MTNLAAVSDRLLEAIKKKDPNFPLGSSECMMWLLNHSNCQGCKYFPRCHALVIGLEIGVNGYDEQAK